MSFLHNVMVKKHSTKDKILMLLLSNKNTEFTIRSISKNVAVDYKTVYLIVNELIKSKVIVAKKVGQTVLCLIDQKMFSADVFRAELIRREELLKNKNLFVLQSYFNKIRESFFILLLFGSYAAGKQEKKSDIDLMLITDDEKIKRQVEEKLSLIPLNTHLVDFTSGEFLSMLKTTEFNVGKEALNNNVILYGIEDYYRLIKNA